MSYASREELRRIVNQETVNPPPPGNYRTRIVEVRQPPRYEVQPRNPTMPFEHTTASYRRRKAGRWFCVVCGLVFGTAAAVGISGLVIPATLWVLIVGLHLFASWILVLILGPMMVRYERKTAQLQTEETIRQTLDSDDF